ncbi:hypothetical protein EWB00_001853 [Schistosoma japonicum]|uniref:Uncharacterized protein n=1 Tax=Schistosoma japonicum TaxID=6182 RepID=A0A4Z2DDT2_SCHJA|nr:hypothetical protein EWB00_001853 [Schistosoma japonicum]
MKQQQKINEEINNFEGNQQKVLTNNHDDDIDDNDEVDIENEGNKKLYAYLTMKSPTDSGQTSKNISPLPISHTISDVLLSPKFRSKQMIYRLGQQYKTHRSTSSTLPSPLLQHIPEMLNSNNHHSNSHQLPYQQRNNNLHKFTTMSTTAITKYPTSSFVEPKTNMASLTYSPRSRHPCRLQNKIIDPFKPTNKDNINSSITLSSIPSKSTLITTSNMNALLTQQNRQIGNNSPPPLPPPPKHLIYMLGGDSSIYSTPHGSPQQSIARKLMSFNSTTPTITNNNNISVEYSPDLLHMTSILKHESPTAGSFRQTDSGVTGMGGSLIESEHYEPNTIIA